jgi:hypothetical protein
MVSGDLIFQEIRIHLGDIPNLIFELFRHVILFGLWCNEKKALKTFEDYPRSCFYVI